MLDESMTIKTLAKWNKCWLLGHRVSRNTCEIRCWTHALRMHIFNTPVGPVTSTCVSYCQSISWLSESESNNVLHDTIVTLICWSTFGDFSFWLGGSLPIFFTGHTCDPFYWNETLLCKTPNGDKAENTLGGDFCQFWDFCKIPAKS